MIRKPLPGDQRTLAGLLSMVVPDDPNTDSFALQLATVPIPVARAGAFATGTAWVAEQSCAVTGLIVAAPPLSWLTSVPGVSRERCMLMSHCIVQCEYLAVEPAARGHHLGALLTSHAAHHCTTRGFRLMTAAVTADNFHLIPYYRSMGWKPLPPGEGLGVTDAANSMVAWRPTEPDVVQMWMPLHNAVTARRWPNQNGTVLAGVLPPAA
ncbi:GNAT family N-acetyltransferase [Streptomyces erythrochromogenes]|uniref:GNAT family N-acetyltransferase n=1 Tax=Streptomyces erythrochromogenes TaxID=285574 RepID=UPI003400EF8D